MPLVLLQPQKPTGQRRAGSKVPEIEEKLVQKPLVTLTNVVHAGTPNGQLLGFPVEADDDTQAATLSFFDKRSSCTSGADIDMLKVEHGRHEYSSLCALLDARRLKTANCVARSHCMREPLNTVRL